MELIWLQKENLKLKIYQIKLKKLLHTFKYIIYKFKITNWDDQSHPSPDLDYLEIDIIL